MAKLLLWLLVVFAVGMVFFRKHPSHVQNKGIFLENLTWVEAEKALTPDTVVVIPLGGGSKEHGPHLPLNTDWVQAEYYKHAIAKQTNVVIAPTISYSFYPAFLEYPGSISIDEKPARYMIIDTCRHLSAYGPKRFYVINVGVSTVVPLRRAAAELKEEGIILEFSGMFPLTPKLKWVKNIEGSHAHEGETSVMLFIAPQKVSMRKAVRDFSHDAPGGLTRDPKNKKAVYSPTGIWGDATRATRAKGEMIVRASVAQMVKDIEALRHRTLAP